MALLDSSMTMATGFNALAPAISRGSRTRIVLLATSAEVQSIFTVANLANGIIPRDVLPEVLIHDLWQEACTTTDDSEKALVVVGAIRQVRCPFETGA
jgi:DNA-binding NarL/FixJ family response regulator